MSNWFKVSELALLKQCKRLKVSVEGRDLALFYCDGEVFALDDRCIHKGSSLSKGHVFKGKVVCPGHQWAFDLRTGAVSQSPKCQPVVPTRITDEVIYVNLEPADSAGGSTVAAGAGDQK